MSYLALTTVDASLLSGALLLLATSVLLTARKLTKAMARIENSHHQMGQKILNL